MKTLKKNFEVKKVTVESMAECYCNGMTNCHCNNHCQSYSDWTGLINSDAIQISGASLNVKS